MKSNWLTRGGAAAVLLAAILSSSCGGNQGRSPSQLVIVSLGTPVIENKELQGGNGVPGKIEQISTFGPGPLSSDISSLITDQGQVALRYILRDPGAPGAPAAPTPLNDITVTEYEVKYRLPNGRNTPGVDVPYPIRGGLTLTTSTSAATALFDLVRVVAKQEPPLAALKSTFVVITMIADVTFYGRDQAGNAVSATGNVQINFADRR